MLNWIDLLTWAVIVGLGVVCGRLAASRRRLRSDLNLVLDAELAAGEAARPPGQEPCEICGQSVPHRVSVSVQTDAHYRQVWLCPMCMEDDHALEEQIARKGEY